MSSGGTGTAIVLTFGGGGGGAITSALSTAVTSVLLPSSTGAATTGCGELKLAQTSGGWSGSGIAYGIRNNSRAPFSSSVTVRSCSIFQQV